MKENLNRAVHGELGDCMDLEVTHQSHLGRTEDHREAARAFVEKRSPVFRGRWGPADPLGRSYDRTRRLNARMPMARKATQNPISTG